MLFIKQLKFLTLNTLISVRKSKFIVSFSLKSSKVSLYNYQYKLDFLLSVIILGFDYLIDVKVAINEL